MPKRPETFRMRPKPVNPDYRPSAHKRGYGRNWQRLRTLVLSREPLCRLCRVNDGRHVPAEHVDHIVAIEAGGSKTDPRNLMPLCHSCHSRKTVERDGGLGHAPRSEPNPIGEPHVEEQ